MPAYLTVHTTWSDWKIVDAAMDNSGSLAAVEGRTDVVERTSTVREAGWLATGPIDRSYMDEGEWPPPASVFSELVAVTLMTDDWRFVSAELRRWARLDDEDGSQLSTLADMIDSALGFEELAWTNGDTGA